MARKRYRRSSVEFTFRPGRQKWNRKKILRSVLNWSVIVLVAAILGYSVVTFGYQTVEVVGPSMNGTLEDGETVLVNKLVYRFKDVERFDVIAYSKVEDDSYYDIKRVIALPGETVQIKDGRIYIDGSELQVDKISGSIITAGIAQDEIKLGKDQYFVLGDNINNSEDSRYVNVGNVSGQEILGKVTKIISPKSKKSKVK